MRGKVEFEEVSKWWTIVCDFQRNKRLERSFKGSNPVLVRKGSLEYCLETEGLLYTRRGRRLPRDGRGVTMQWTRKRVVSERRGPGIQFVSFLGILEKVRAIGEASNTHT